jgi:hypothetical protein
MRSCRGRCLARSRKTLHGSCARLCTYWGYDTWIDTVVAQGSNGGDFARELVRQPAYKSVAITLHWPSRAVDGSGSLASRLPSPVTSVFLAQGALSLWSYAGQIPSFAGQVGAYQPIEVSTALIDGPLVTTRSAYDTANGAFFPLAARFGSPDIMAEARARVLAIANGQAPAVKTYPDYGAVGT